MHTAVYEKSPKFRAWRFANVISWCLLFDSAHAM